MKNLTEQTLDRLATTKEWLNFTMSMNEIIDDYNSKGIKIDDEALTELRKIRLIYAISENVGKDETLKNYFRGLLN